MAENESAPLLTAVDTSPPQYSDITAQNPCEYHLVL